MKKATLNWLHLCDAATTEIMGKVNLLGIFTRVFLAEFPNIFPRFCVVANFTLEDLGTSRNRIDVKIFPPEDPEQADQEPLFVDTAIFDANQPPAEENEMNSISDVDAIAILSPGAYTVRVYFNGEEIGHGIFVAEQRKG